MSEEALRRFVERLNAEASFRERVQQDCESVFDEFELSPAERMALGTQDEDALRRLLGAEVAGFGGGGEVAWIVVTGYCTYGCTPTWNCVTPGSKKHCGTGQCAGRVIG